MTRKLSASMRMRVSGSRQVLLRVSLGLGILAYATNTSAIDAEDVDRYSNVGLGQPQKTRQLAEAFCEIDFSDFSINLQENLNNILSASLNSYMPAPFVTFKSDVWGIGYFSHRRWTIELSTKLLSRKKMVRILQILTHELRHAEQRYMSARYHAAIGANKDNRHAYTNLPSRIIDHALDNPSEQGTAEFEFGRFISIEIFDEDLEEKKKYLLEKMERHKNDREKFNFYSKKYMNELPRERDAKTVDLALKRAVEKCQPREHD